MNEGYESEGISGLKALGVRDLNYRMAFLACAVTSSNPRVSLLSVNRLPLRFQHSTIQMSNQLANFLIKQFMVQR